MKSEIASLTFSKMFAAPPAPCIEAEVSSTKIQSTLPCFASPLMEITAARMSTTQAQRPDRRTDFKSALAWRGTDKKSTRRKVDNIGVSAIFRTDVPHRD